jgi:hypothetical protein
MGQDSALAGTTAFLLLYPRQGDFLGLQKSMLMPDQPCEIEVQAGKASPLR